MRNFRTTLDKKKGRSLAPSAPPKEKRSAKVLLSEGRPASRKKPDRGFLKPNPLPKARGKP